MIVGKRVSGDVHNRGSMSLRVAFGAQHTTRLCLAVGLTGEPRTLKGRMSRTGWAAGVGGVMHTLY